MTQTSSPTLQVAGVQIVKAAELPSHFQGLIWGAPGAGKTELACTAPGQKLIINFDPNGPATVARRDDVSTLDFSGSENKLTNEFKKPDPFGISKIGAEFDTWIVDSLSSVQEMTTRSGVDFANSQSRQAVFSIENPGLQAYGARNALMLELVRNMLKVAVANGKNLIFIGHEGQKDRDKDGNVINIPILLGGSLPTNVGVKLSEIWTLYDLDGGKKKTIAIRPARMREIAKSRMFQTNGSPEFTWKYNPEIPDEEQLGATIAGWHQAWLDNGKKKIPLPT